MVRAMSDTPSLQFLNGRCVSAQVQTFESETINAFFRNIIAHYHGKAPAEIAKHARAYSEAVKEWPAPRDAMFGWSLMQACVRMHLDQFANEADAAALEMERAA